MASLSIDLPNDVLQHLHEFGDSIEQTMLKMIVMDLPTGTNQRRTNCGIARLAAREIYF